MPNLFTGERGWIAHRILRNLNTGKPTFDSLTDAEDVLRNLVEEGFLTPTGILTARGRYAAAYPHLASSSK